MAYRIKITTKNSIKEQCMKVAFATKDFEYIDDHFGWAKQFVVYNITKDGFSIDEIIRLPDEQLEEEDKIASRIEALKGTNILYCQAIGPTAAAKVIHNKIHPIKVENQKRIDEALNELIRMLNGNPPPWIKRILAKEGL